MVSEPIISEGPIGLIGSFGMTVDELRGELGVGSIPYAGLTEVELQVALTHALGLAVSTMGQGVDRSHINIPVLAADPQADHDPAPEYSEAVAQVEPDHSPQWMRTHYVLSSFKFNCAA